MLSADASTSPWNRTSPSRPASATATALRSLATSIPTKASLISAMVRPPLVRRGSYHPAGGRSVASLVCAAPHWGGHTVLQLILQCHELLAAGGGSKLRRQQGQRGSRRISATARCRRRVAIESGLCRSGRTGGAPGPVAGRGLGGGGPGSPARRGKAAALGRQEGVRGDAQGRVVVEAAPAAALEVAEPQ